MRTLRQVFTWAIALGVLTLALVSSALASPGEYRVRPDETARHANGTPNDYRAKRLGDGRVDLALFECNRVHSERNDPRFEGRNGAKRGSPDAEISVAGGGGSGEYVSRVKPKDGKVEFEVGGQSTCAQPVVFDDEDGDEKLDIDRKDRPEEPYGIGAKTRFSPIGVETANAERCDFLDPAVCLQPWPNDHFSKNDGGTQTGRRLDLERESMPKNRAGKPIEPADYNRLDGFSPGQMITTKVPELESVAAFRKTGAVPITDIARYRDEKQAVVVLNADTGERHPIFSEIDANPKGTEDVNLLIRPAENFDEGGRYIVALRDLEDSDGDELKAGRGFRLYRDRIITSDDQVERRRDHMEALFRKLGRSGIERDSLYLAWDFTVASRQSLSERALSIRDRAFRDLGDDDLSDLKVQGDSPRFAVTGTQNFDGCGDDGCDEDPLPGQNPESDTLARRVEGQVVVPCYLDQPACPSGSKFAFEPGSDRPTQNAVPTNANFVCNIPRSAVDGGVDPARPSLYGHGLLGSAGEVGAGNVKDMGNEHNFVFCATDWVGFATQDLPNVAAILQDLSRFPTLVDRTQQGFVNFMYLGRAMIHPDGFGDDPAFRFGGQSVIDDERLFYDGNSQGGILGGSLTALAPDFNRAVLGVPGMNYSTLLRRSVDFDTFAEAPGVGLYANYPNELERPLILSLLQTYWDRGEANGYAHHMTDDPLPDTPKHKVLMHVAFGDHQVANVTAEIEARTNGAAVREPALDPGRHTDKDPFFGLETFRGDHDGSALVYWDTGPLRDGGSKGTPPPPTANVPPREGNDPHGAPRATPDARDQKSKFLKVGGKVANTCGDSPCYSGGYEGP